MNTNKFIDWKVLLLGVGLTLLFLQFDQAKANNLTSTFQQGNAYVPSRSTINNTQYKNCEYVHQTMLQASKLDTGNDPNFERIKQQNNRQIIIACQEELIKQLRNNTRDNY